MKNNWKKMISIILSLCMIVSLLPIGILADANDPAPTDIIPGSDTDPILSFIFTVDGVEYAKQNIRSGESLLEPAAPYKESMKFLGWFTEDGAPFTTFNQPLSVTNDAADANTSLKGAVFALYRVGASDDILVSTYTTDGNGLIVVADLVPGMYYWKEISAPEGYLLDAQKYYFTVEISENTYVTLTNVRAPIPDVFTLDHFAYVIDYPDGTVRKSRFCSNRCTVR